MTTAADKLERIKQITLQLKMLTNELSVLTGLANTSIKDMTDNPDFILDLVTMVFGSNPRVKSRKSPFSLARYAATFLLKRYTRFNQDTISKLMGGVEHSVVSYRMDKAKDLMEVDVDFQQKVRECMVRIELQL